METMSMNTENSKTSGPHKFVFNLLQRLDLRSSNKPVALQKLFNDYMWKNIGQQCKNDKLKIIAQTWNDEFELLDDSYSVSNIQDYIDYIIKKHDTLSTNPPIHIYIIMINNRPVFKIKDECKLKLQTPEAVNLFCSTKNVINKKRIVKKY